MEEKQKKLTFSDGLNFGCGFWTAGFVFSIVMTVILFILMTIVGGGILTGLG